MLILRQIVSGPIFFHYICNLKQLLPMKIPTVILLLSALTLAPVSEAQRHWEEMESELVVTDHSDNTDILDISVKDGYVYITTSKPVTVKIFSILGQLISQKKLQPGTTRTHITARGIYILKAGSITRRITI